VIYDPAGSLGGSGAQIAVTLDNSATFNTSSAVFGLGDVGKVIRMGEGIAVITAFSSPTQVTANIVQPIVVVVPESGLPQQQTSGNWTMAASSTTVSGLNHLIGATVTGLAD